MPSAKKEVPQTPGPAVPVVAASPVAQPVVQQEGYTAEQVLSELRREELEQESGQEGNNGNGADHGGNGASGNGHNGIDPLGEEEFEENIFLRTAGDKDIPRPKAMIPRMMRADSFGEAQIAAIVPKTIVINPMLIQVGMGITFNEWGWDSKMPPSQWLDEVLKWFFWYCGYEITPWRKLTPQEMGIVIEGG